MAQKPVPTILLYILVINVLLFRVLSANCRSSLIYQLVANKYRLNRPSIANGNDPWAACPTSKNILLGWVGLRNTFCIWAVKSCKEAISSEPGSLFSVYPTGFAGGESKEAGFRLLAD